MLSTHVKFNGKVCHYEMQLRFEMFNKDPRPIHLLFADQTFKLILSGALSTLQFHITDVTVSSKHRFISGKLYSEFGDICHCSRNSKFIVHLTN